MINIINWDLANDKPKIVISNDDSDPEFSKTANEMWNIIEGDKTTWVYKIRCIVDTWNKCDHGIVSSSTKAGTEKDTILKEMNTFSNSFTCPNGIM